MALSLLSSLSSALGGSSGGSSPLSITNATSGSKSIKTVKPVSVTIKMTSTIMRHMREDGQTFADTRIIQPTSISIEGIAPDFNTIKQVNALLQDRTNIYNVTSKGVTVKQLMADSNQMPQTAQYLSAGQIKLEMRQVLTKSVEPAVCAQSGDTSLVSAGLSLLSAAASTVSGLVSKVSSVAGIFH